MGARQSAEDAPPATPADYARRELSKPVDDDALWARRSAPPKLLQPTIGAKKFREDDGNAASPSNTGDVTDVARPGDHAASQRGVDEGEQAPSQKSLVLKGHTDRVFCLAVLDGGLLASSGRDKSIIIWNLADGTQLAKLEGHTSDVYCLAALADGQLASGSFDSMFRGELIIWNLADGTQIAKLEGHEYEVGRLVALDDDRLASLANDEIIIWNLADSSHGTQLAKLKGEGSLAALDGNRLASGGHEHTIIIWNLADGTALAKLEGHTERVDCLAALDGARLASGSKDKSIIIWDLADGKQLAKLEGHTRGVNCLVALGDDRLASCAFDNTIRIWNIAVDAKDGEVSYNNGEANVLMWGQNGGISCLVVLEDGRLLSAGGDNGLIRTRPVRGSPAFLRIAECGSAFEFEEVARECRENNVLDDLIDAAEHQALYDKDKRGLMKPRDATTSSSAIVTQAHVFDAIATVVNEKDTSTNIDSLAPRVLDLVRDDSLLPDMGRRDVSNAAIQELAASPLFRVVLDAKYVAGPRFVLYCEMFLFIALMICFGRIAGLEILGWTKYYGTEKVVLLVFGFAILVWFSGRELYQMISARAIELARPENPLGDWKPRRGFEVKVTGLAWYALAIPRYVLLILMCLVQLPVYLVIKESSNPMEPRTLPEGVLYAWNFTRRKKGEEKNDRIFLLRLFMLNPPTAQGIIHDPLTFLGAPRAWRRDYWNLVDVATIGCAFASFVRAALPGGRLSVNLAAVTSLLLWIMFLQFVKDFSLKFSKFVLMFERVVGDLYIFVAFFFIILLMFATTFYLYLGTKTRSDIGYHDDGEPTHYSTFPKTLFSLYLLGLLGDFDLDTFENKALKFILVLFVFIVTVVLLNVLIAIVSKSHDSIDEKTAAALFYRSRLEYITETTPVARLLPSWLRREEDEDSIKERIRDAFARHKEDVSNIDTDAARLAAIRESDEKTSRRLAAIESKIDGDLAAMKTKIDNLTDMLQALLDKERK